VDTTEATADLVQALDPAGAMLGFVASINTLGVQNTPVSLFEAGLADAAGEPGFCSGAFIGFGVTDITGFVEFGVAAGTYCLSTDVDNNGDTEATLVTVAAGDPAGDVDGSVDTTHDAALDVLANNTFTAEAFVSVFVADVGDVYGNAGTCAGLLVSDAFTTNDTATFGLAAGNYCVMAEPDDFLVAGNTGLVILLVGDPPNDVDIVLNTF
jgi:hypothetical protein